MTLLWRNIFFLSSSVSSGFFWIRSFTSSFESGCESPTAFVSIADSGTPCPTRKFLTEPTRRSESAWLYLSPPRGSAWPVRVRRASGLTCRYALKSVAKVVRICSWLSAKPRSGRFSFGRAVGKKTLWSVRDGGGGGGGGGGASIVTLVFADAVCPLSSATLQVICTGPGDAPVDANVPVVPLPLTVPPA